MQRVLPISPGVGFSSRTFLGAAEQLMLAGVRQLVVREPSWTSSRLREVLGELDEMDSLIVHECCEDAEILALETGCGLHMSSRTALAGLRERFDGLLGVSTHGRESLLRAEDAGADYALLSPIYAPYSKPDDTRTPLGVRRAVEACRDVSIPVFFLGGIDEGRARDCMDSGAYGVAMIGALFGEDARTHDVATALLEAVG
ncbi:MAG: thiamine phosphate synthase [Myxococcota bacterium]|nr:thiamine phosphate synthase [Myxococcota bacterium]